MIYESRFRRLWQQWRQPLEAEGGYNDRSW